jgi:predicted O-methyltransferase YrrM
MDRNRTHTWYFMKLPRHLETVEDPRLNAVRDAIAAFEDGKLVDGRLDLLEAERTRLLADQSSFDDRDGPATVAEFTGRVSKSTEWCRFLHVLTRGLAPTTVVEMGTGVGISAGAIATALHPGSSMWTVDLRPESGEQARRLLIRLGAWCFVVTGRFDEVLEQVLSEAKPVDMLFVDGHHRQRPTLRYTELAAPYLSNHAVVVYDDITWSNEMQLAWLEITSQERWAWSIDLGGVGVCAIRG